MIKTKVQVSNVALVVPTQGTVAQSEQLVQVTARGDSTVVFVCRADESPLPGDVFEMTLVKLGPLQADRIGA